MAGELRRLLESIENKLGLLAELVGALVELEMARARPLDGSLPLADDGACPECGAVRGIVVPEGEGREEVRECRKCGNAWRVRMGEDVRE